MYVSYDLTARSLILSVHVCFCFGVRRHVSPGGMRLWAAQVAASWQPEGRKPTRSKARNPTAEGPNPINASRVGPQSLDRSFTVCGSSSCGSWIHSTWSHGKNPYHVHRILHVSDGQCLPWAVLEEPGLLDGCSLVQDWTWIMLHRHAVIPGPPNQLRLMSRTAFCS